MQTLFSMDASIVAHDLVSRELANGQRDDGDKRRRWHTWLFTGALSLVAAGCAGDTAGPPVPTSLDAYWALQLNVHAVNMATVAPFDTVRLIATPRNSAGALLSELGSVTYHTLDSAVSVNAAGLVTAHFVTPAGSYAKVVASLQDQTLNATHTDTVFIQVTDTVPHNPLARFSLQPALGDSAKRAVDYLAEENGGNTASFLWPAKATDVHGGTICDTTACPLVVYYTSSNPLVASIDSHSGLVVAHSPGHAVFTATTWTYGVDKRDSVEFAIGYKTNLTISIGLSTQLGGIVLGFDAQKRVVLGRNALVTWQCIARNDIFSAPLCDRPVDVVFDHPSATDTGSKLFYSGQLQVGPNGRGNIPAFGGDSLEPGDIFTSIRILLQADLRMRRFPTPGTYNYHSTLFPSDTFEIVIQ